MSPGARALREQRLAERRAEARAAGALSPLSFAARTSMGFVVLAALVGGNYLLFDQLFDRNYFSWYIENGPLISVVFALISASIDLDAIPDLVSRHPLIYLAGQFHLRAMHSAGWAAELSEIDEKYQSADWAHKVGEVTDEIFKAIIWQILVLVLLAWLFVVVPIQYFAFLVCGSMARAALRSPSQAVYDPAEREIVIGESKTANLSASTMRIGFWTKPVTYTSAVTAGVLFGLSHVL
jgi:hypothetical protein